MKFKDMPYERVDFTQVEKEMRELMEEFDSQSGTRYSGYIAGLLHEESVKRKIAYIINEKRKEIYCDIYLSRKGHEEDGEQ